MGRTRPTYQKLLAELKFRSRSATQRELQRELRALRRTLPSLPVPGGMRRDVLKTCLQRRQAAFVKKLGGFYKKEIKRLAAAHLQAEHAYPILFGHCALLDAMHEAACETAVEELPLLVALLTLDGEKTLSSRQAWLKEKTTRSAAQGREVALEDAAEDATRPAAERVYYRQLRADLRKNMDEARADIAALEARLAFWLKFRLRRTKILGRMVLFARGGYGRGELSFSSDLDTGYCIDTRHAAPGERELFEELVLRVGALLKGCGIHSAQQYFQLDEDLIRFAERETLHTIPSVLEGRPLFGAAELLNALKSRFAAICPYELFVTVKLEAFEHQLQPSLAGMDLKEGRGGLRSIQIPLWIVGITHSASSYGSAALIELAREKGLLSIQEASHLLRALELWHELRNFLGLLSLSGHEKKKDKPMVPNAFTPELACRYVAEKQRFDDAEALERMRLRLSAEAARIGEALLQRVLDRSLTYALGELRIAVHLGQKRITRIEQRGGKWIGSAWMLLSC